jgi:hypothetical protein
MCRNQIKRSLVNTRVSLFRFFKIFASKRNEAKRILFRFIFACFCETNTPLFSLLFALFRIDFFRFFALYRKTLVSLLCVNFFTSKHFFRYFATTFSLRITFLRYFASTFFSKALFSLFRLQELHTVYQYCIREKFFV